MSNWESLIFARNTEGIIKYVQEGGNPNFIEYDRSILSLVAACGYIDVAETLLSLGAEIDMPNTDDLAYTPLIEAVRENKLEMVKFLVKKGANLEAVDSRNGTALFNASIAANEEILNFLISSGANINAQADQGYTALHYLCSMAAQWGSYKITETVNGVTRDVENPRIGQLKRIVEMLLQHQKETDHTTSDGFSSLHLAAGSNAYQFIGMLVSRGANVNLQNKHGITPLHSACHAGSVEALKELIFFGADPDLQDNWGVTPVLLATTRGHHTLVGLLKEEGANLSIPATKALGNLQVGDTALDVAKRMQDDTLIALLS